MGVNLRVGVADGANVGVTVGVNVKVGVGVIVGLNNCPGAQLDIAKLKNRTSIIAVRCFVFISFSCAITGAPSGCSSEPQNF